MPPSPMRERMRYAPICSGVAGSAYWLGQSLGATLDEPIALPAPPVESVGGPLSSVSADGFTSADDALGVSGSDMRCAFQLNEPRVCGRLFRTPSNDDAANLSRASMLRQ